MVWDSGLFSDQNDNKFKGNLNGMYRNNKEESSWKLMKDYLN